MADRHVFDTQGTSRPRKRSVGMTKSPDKLEGTRKLMAALVRMPPKPHEEMKLGKAQTKKKRPKNEEKK